MCGTAAVVVTCMDSGTALLDIGTCNHDHIFQIQIIRAYLLLAAAFQMNN